MSVEDLRAEVERIMLGKWKVGEVPAAFEYTFLDYQGEPIVLSGFTGKLQWIIGGDDTTLEQRNLTVTDQLVTPGLVTYQWAADDFADAGVYDGEAWVGNLTVRLASVDIGWVVRRSMTPAPAI